MSLDNYWSAMTQVFFASDIASIYIFSYPQKSTHITLPEAGQTRLDSKFRPLNLLLSNTILYE